MKLSIVLYFQKQMANTVMLLACCFLLTVIAEAVEPFPAGSNSMITNEKRHWLGNLMDKYKHLLNQRFAGRIAAGRWHFRPGLINDHIGNGF